MRLNRMSGATPTNSMSAPPPAAAEQQTPESGIQESFVQSDAVEERDASPRSVEESELLAMFPGIAEGLTPEYFDSGWALTPPPAQTSAFEPSEIDQALVLKWSETIHLKNRLLEELSSHPSEVASLVRAVLDEEGVLESFVSEEALGEPADFVSELNDLFDFSVTQSQLWHDGLYELIRGYSQAYFSHRYALEMTQQTKSVISHYFGELFLDLPVIVKVLEAEQNNASHEWVSGQHRLTMEVKEAFGDHRQDLADLVSSGSFDQGYNFRRGVTDLISFVHEYAHGIYDKTLGVPASIKMTRVNRAISEGFAILLELLAIDCVSEESSDMDRRDFQERRDQRILWLQGALKPGADDALMAYAEGVELMVNVFRGGGLGAVRDFVSQVQAARADTLKRSNPKYREVIAVPEGVLELVS